jgi:hypothetical protein
LWYANLNTIQCDEEGATRLDAVKLNYHENILIHRLTTEDFEVFCSQTGIKLVSIKESDSEHTF